MPQLLLLSSLVNPAPCDWYLCKGYPPALLLSDCSHCFHSPPALESVSSQLPGRTYKVQVKVRPFLLVASLTLRKNFIICPGRSYMTCLAFLTDLIFLLTFLDLSVSETFKFMVWGPCTCYFISMKYPSPVCCTVGSFHSCLSPCPFLPDDAPDHLPESRGLVQTVYDSTYLLMVTPLLFFLLPPGPIRWLLCTSWYLQKS